MQRFLYSVLVGCMLLRPSHGQDYHLIELGDLGGTTGEALGINEQRSIVGLSHNSAQVIRPFWWANGVMTDLGDLPGGEAGIANAVNNFDIAVGWNSGLSLGVTGVAWNNGQVFVVNGIGQPQDTNDFNEVVGFTGPAPSTAQLLSNGNLIQLDLGGAYAGQAYAINNAGQVVGWITGGAALWEPSNGYALTRLSAPPGSINAFAYDINSSGVIVGVADLGIDDHAFRYENGVMHSLGTAGESSYAHAINDTGIIVGETRVSGSSQRRGVIWINDVLYDVNNLINHTLEVEALFDINNKGQIVGMAKNGNTSVPILLMPLITISDVSPARAGVINTITINGATPLGNVVLFASTAIGQTTVGCATLDLGGQVTVAAHGTADHVGDVLIDRFVSPAQLGQQVHLQAVDQSNCAVSEVFTVTFN